MSKMELPADPAPEGAPFTLADEFPEPTREQWREVVDSDLKGVPYEKKLVWKSLEGISIEPLFRREDIENVAHRDAMPGSAPYVRGSEPLGGILPKWQIRQDCMLAAPEDVNGALRDGIARGQTAIGVRLDNAARRGLDGDSPEAADRAGFGGMTVSSLNGIRIAMQDIDLERYPVSYRTGSAAMPVLAMHLALAKERGIDPRLLTGSVECDPIRELVKSGHLRGESMTLRLREMAEMASYCSENCPGIRPVLVNGHPWHNGGATAVQELGYTIAAGVTYLRALMDHGLKVDQAALSMIFSLSISPNVFMEIAKIRAARMLWAKVMRAFGAENDYAEKMFLHLRTSTISKTKYDPYNNMLRSAIEAFAGAVAGCDSMYVAPFDEVLGRPDNFSMRVARNQQIILQEEVHLNKVVDPAGGSYYVESLTESIGKAAWELFQQVEEEGGIVESLKRDTPQAAIAEASRKRAQLVAQRRMAIVGISNYANSQEELVEKGHFARGNFLAERRKRLALLKRVRQNSSVRHLLGAITDAMMGGEIGSVMPLAIDAANEGATIGEVVEALNDANEEQALEVTPIHTVRPSEPFEALRDRIQNYKKENGEAPGVYMVTTGPLTMRRARADFSHGFFSPGGFAVSESNPQETPEAAAKDAAKANAMIYVLCSDDPTYSDFGPPFVKALKDARPESIVYIAGYPEAALDKLKEAGFDGFVHIKANVLEELKSLLDRLHIN